MWLKSALSIPNYAKPTIAALLPREKMLIYQ